MTGVFFLFFFPRHNFFFLQHFVSVCFADGKEESLLEKRRELSREVSKMRQTYEHLVSRFPNLRFEYK